VWALAVRGADEVVSGAGDSVLNVWRDVTRAEAAEAAAESEALLERQQALAGAMAARDYGAAVALALELDQPRRCGDILAELLESGPAPATAGLTPAQRDAQHRDDMLAELAALQGYDDPALAATVAAAAAAAAAGRSAPPAPPRGAAAGEAAAVRLLRGLAPLPLGRLLIYVREWNTQARRAQLAQHVAYLVLRHLPRSALLDACRAVLAAQRSGAVLRVLPGLGSLLARPDAGALGRLDSLAPVIDPGDAAG